ncbi:YigZ family protein [Salibacterium lacus]|uniref:YigZ family protein n=1 Tax=Salibacterium lacus TaxID=1898109 RepID=A0ABW5T0Y0_9BACI
MPDTYYTVKQRKTNEITINKSRFIAHLARVTTEEEAQTFIDAVKKEHAGATHNCSAYLAGENDEIQKAHDDGEPSRTAGVPMLEVLKKKELKDTCVVVTRYFGGIKLGAGGLIRAYGQAVSAGLEASGIVQRTRMKVMSASVDYTLLGRLENDLRQSSYLLKDISYEDIVTFYVYVPAGGEEAFTSWVTNTANGQVEINEIEETYLEQDVTS